MDTFLRPVPEEDGVGKHHLPSCQPDFPPLAQYNVAVDPHTFCGVEVACKDCSQHKECKGGPHVQFAAHRPPMATEHLDRRVYLAGEPVLLNEDFSATSEATSSDGDPCENAFDPFKAGHDVELVGSNRIARRCMPVGGSRLVVGHLGACTGQVIWKVRIDRCGLDKGLRTQNADLESAFRMKRMNVHGVKVGVAQKGANLKWFAGFDKNSYGLDWQGDVWSEGKPIKTHLIDGGGRRGVCFKEGDVVSVMVEFKSEKPTLKYAVNDVPLPGAYYLSSFKPGKDLFLAVSLLWPGEQATFLSEELYE
jgi:hypothetical protein